MQVAAVQGRDVLKSVPVSQRGVMANQRELTGSGQEGGGRGHLGCYYCEAVTPALWRGKAERRRSARTTSACGFDRCFKISKSQEKIGGSVADHGCPATVFSCFGT